MRTWLLMALLACDTPEIGPQEGRRAPDIEATALSGARVDLSDLRGAPVVLVFWASWCGPCKKEVPELRALREHYGERIHVVSVNAGEDPAIAARAAREWGLAWPVVPDTTASIARAYAVSAIPLVLILDADGRVRYRGNGMPTDAHRLLDGLLG